MKKWMPLIESTLAVMLLWYSIFYGSVEWVIFASIICCQLYKEKIK